MKPIRIFLFILTILLIAELYKHRYFFYTNLEGELPELVPLPQLPDTCNIHTDTSEIGLLDTMPEVISSIPTFFEGVDPLDAFGTLMRRLTYSNDSLVRIIFMGDSQLEGDFFTHHVRKKLQEHFGGIGIGYMPVETYYNATEALAIITNDFDKYLAGDSPTDSVEFGLYGRFFIPNSENNVISIKNRNPEHRFSTLKVLCSGKGTLELTDRKGFTSSRSVDCDSTIIIDFLLETVPVSLFLTVKSEQHFKIDGLLFDPLSGVVVDHLPFRGKLNVRLKAYGSQTLMSQCQLLQPALVVLQYGLNVVPDVRSEYGNYRVALQQDLQLLKKYLPNASFLVMGVPDMARKEAGVMVSYPNLSAVIDAQREAAVREKVAFWNFREAMGGKGAMVSWVDEGLGRTDYAHLTAAGAEKAANIFVNDLIQVISTPLADD